MIKRILLLHFLVYIFIFNISGQVHRSVNNNDLVVSSVTGDPVSSGKLNPHGNYRNLCLNIENPSYSKLRINFYGRKKSVISDNTTSAAISNGKFTIILLPDTQYYTAEPQGTRGGSNTIFKRQIRWIVNNKVQRNIVYVGHVGDCSEHGDQYPVEWKRADTAMKLLEDSGLTGLAEGIPFGVCVGNHDQTPKGSFSGSTTLYNKYFGTARYKGRSYYGGHYGTNNDNFYELFSVGNYNFLVIYFEFNTSTSNFTAAGGPLDWAENLVKNHPGRNIIVISHYVLTATGTFNSQGANIYKRLKIYPNFKLMLGGHVPDSAAEAVKVSTYNGNKVYTVLSNYQGRAKGGNGLLRIYEFDPANKNVSVKTYSPYTSTFETDANSQFNMNVSLISNPNNLSADTFHLISELKEVPSATNANTCISWSSLDENSTYEWYAEVFAGEKRVSTPIQSFNTDYQLRPEISSNANKPKPVESNELFTLYPNPNSTNNVTLYFNKKISGEANLNIFTLTGQRVFQKTFVTSNNTLNIAHNLPTGTYIVTISTATGIDEKKLMVIK